MPRKFNLNSRTITAPLAALTMAGLLFVYTRTSIQAAKRNAQKHREADGGQINWHNETLRRHGVLAPPEEQKSVKQLMGIARENVVDAKKGADRTETMEERRLREMVAKGRNG